MVAEQRIPHARLIVFGAGLIGAAAILWLTRTYTFYFDEWDFILTAPDWTWLTYLQPHNEHPVMLTRLVYAALLSTAGLRSYTPYMASLMAFHVANVVLVFELTRRRAGDVVGMGCAAVLLVLGAGWEDLLWAFQIAFMGAVTCGLGAFLVLEWPSTPSRGMAAAALLAGSIMFSGIGLFFAIAAAVRLALDPSHRRDLMWLLPLAGAVAAWYALFGRHGANNAGIRADNLLALPAYLGWGLVSSAGGLAGIEGVGALVAFVLALAAIALAWRSRRPDSLAVGVAIGLISFYAVTGLSRAQFGFGQSAAGRYVYIGAVFWLVLLAGAARLLPWRGTWRPALIACVFLACFSSSADLFTYATAKTFQMDRAMADLQALAAERTDRCLNPTGAVDLTVMPWVTVPALYYRAVDRYGDPSAGRPVADRADFENAVRNLRKAGC